MKDTLVMKFGGTSVGSMEAIRQVIEITRTAKSDWQNVAIVVSAMSGVTDKLLRAARSAATGDDHMAEKIASELSKRHFDILETGVSKAKITSYGRPFLVKSSLV